MLWCQTWQADGKQQGPVSPVQGCGFGGKNRKKKKTQSGWMISGHLSALQQGVIFKRVETRSHSFCRSGPYSRQNIITVHIPPLSAKCYVGQSHRGSCIMMCFKMFQLVSGYCVVTLIFSHNLFIVPLVCLPFGSPFSFHPPTLSASLHAISSSASCCIVFRGGSARS